jgi:transposase
MRKESKHYTAAEKVAILRRHLLEQDRFQIYVTNRGCNPPCSADGRRSSSRREMLPSASKERREVEEQQKRIDLLEKRFQIYDNALAELLAEHVALKKVAVFEKATGGALAIP